MNAIAQAARCIAIVIATLVMAACDRRFPPPAEPVAAQTTTDVTAATLQTGDSATRVELSDFIGLVETVGSAVVNVTAIERGSTGLSGAAGMPGNESLSEFFRRFGRSSDQEQPRAPVHGMGSGTPAGGIAARGAEAFGIGVSVWPLTAEEREALGTQGVLIVAEVSRAAAAAGVEVGDIILAVNGKPVRAPSELREAIKQADRVAALLIQRGEAQIFVPIPLTKSSR